MNRESWKIVTSVFPNVRVDEIRSFMPSDTWVTFSSAPAQK
jgi:hypothetical protein